MKQQKVADENLPLTEERDTKTSIHQVTLTNDPKQRKQQRHDIVENDEHTNDGSIHHSSLTVPDDRKKPSTISEEMQHPKTDTKQLQSQQQSFSELYSSSSASSSHHTCTTDNEDSHQRRVQKDFETSSTGGSSQIEGEAALVPAPPLGIGHRSVSLSRAEILELTRPSTETQSLMTSNGQLTHISDHVNDDDDDDDDNDEHEDTSNNEQRENMDEKRPFQKDRFNYREDNALNGMVIEGTHDVAAIDNDICSHTEEGEEQQEENRDYRHKSDGDNQLENQQLSSHTRRRNQNLKSTASAEVTERSENNSIVQESQLDAQSSLISRIKQDEQSSQTTTEASTREMATRPKAIATTATTTTTTTAAAATAAATTITSQCAHATALPPVKERSVPIGNNAAAIFSSPGAIEIRGSLATSRFLPYDAETSESEEFTRRNSDMTRNSDISIKHAIALEPELASEYEAAKQERDALRERIKEMEEYNNIESAYAVHIVPLGNNNNENDSSSTKKLDDSKSSSSAATASSYSVAFTNWKNKFCSKTNVICFFIILVVIVVTISTMVGPGAFNSNNDNHDNHDNNNNNNNNNQYDIRHPIATNSPSPAPTKRGKILQSVHDRGFIRCIALDSHVLIGEGITLDLCHAVAAAVFADPYGAANRTKFVDLHFGQQFAALWDGTIDLSTHFTTYNMMRDVREPSTGLGMSFTTPFLYSGMIFFGLPLYVDCADQLDSLTGNCRRLTVCVMAQTVTLDLVNTILPGTKIYAVYTGQDIISGFFNGSCNVIAGDSFGMHSMRLEDLGYPGQYKYGTKLHSNEPIVMTTKDNDQEWADFCNWILHGLITAEAYNITQEIALSDSLWSLYTSSERHSLPEMTTIFGEEYKDMFRNAIAAVGNYGEMYERFFESVIPRSRGGRINSINSGDSGLLYASPFGDLTVKDSAELSQPGPIFGGTLESIINRGVLRCGVVGNRTGFAMLHASEDNNKNNNNQHEDMTMSPNSTRWTGFDIELCRAITASIFPEAFLDNFDKNDAIMIVDVGTNIEDGYVALDKDEIDVFVGGSISLTTDVKDAMTGRGFTFSTPYFYHDDYYYTDDIIDITSSSSNRIGINNNMKMDDEIGLSLVTLEVDPQWSAFVNWIVTAIIYAEQQGITQNNALEMPVVELFGLKYLQMFRDTVSVVGNYGELFNRTLLYPLKIGRSNRNRVNTDGTPQMMAMPFS